MIARYDHPHGQRRGRGHAGAPAPSTAAWNPADLVDWAQLPTDSAEAIAQPRAMRARLP
jgi:hypothetical protein